MKEGEEGKAVNGEEGGEKEGTKPSAAAVSDMGAWGMNVVSSVGIIMANKQLMSSAGYGFSFGIFFFSLFFFFLLSSCNLISFNFLPDLIYQKALIPVIP